ncbi:hypothetical protein ECPV1252_45260 [Escherichia coli]
MLGVEPKNTAVLSPESNGIAESFVKTIKRDYISTMPKPDGLTAAKNLERRSGMITNGILIVRWIIAHHGNI